MTHIIDLDLLPTAVSGNNACPQAKARILTFGQLCELEPKFRLLLIQAAITDDSVPNYSSGHVWYGNASHDGLKDQMIRLLDSLTLPEGVRRSQVYDVAYDTLYDLLPPDKF